MRNYIAWVDNVSPGVIPSLSGDTELIVLSSKWKLYAHHIHEEHKKLKIIINPTSHTSYERKMTDTGSKQFCKPNGKGIQNFESLEKKKYHNWQQKSRERERVNHNLKFNWQDTILC